VKIKPLHLLLRTTFALGLIGLLAACPPPGGTDDDDSAMPPDTGPAPVIIDVLVCEDPDYPPGCPEGAFAVRFAITATDEDDNMNNPWWALLISGMNPMDGYYEGNLVSGGTLNLTSCRDSAIRGTDLDFRLWIQDAEGNDSNDWEAIWTVPASSGDDDCPPPSL
jgi:hypothetical protein